MMNLEQKISESYEKMDEYLGKNNTSMHSYYEGKFYAYIDCRQLNQENTELRAHVERLRVRMIKEAAILLQARYGFEDEEEINESMEKVRHSAIRLSDEAKSETQSLQEHDRQVILKMNKHFKDIKRPNTPHFDNFYITHLEITDYANNLTNGDDKPIKT